MTGSKDCVFNDQCSECKSECSLTPMEVQSLLEQRLTKSGAKILPTLSVNKVDVLHAAMGVCTEAGEIMTSVKKHVVYNQPLDVNNIEEEIGDILFYIQFLARVCKLSLDHAMIKNVEKLNKRYPDGYSDSAAKERLDKKGTEEV